MRPAGTSGRSNCVPGTAMSLSRASELEAWRFPIGGANKNTEPKKPRICQARALDEYPQHRAKQRGLQALLRHRDTRMTMRYSHLTNSYLRTAVDAVNLGAAVPMPGRGIARLD